MDDLADNRELLARRLKRRGFEIVEADCGHDALKLLREQEFDVVLLDVAMPVMNGLDVLKHIRETFSEAILPVIMVSARSQSEDVVAALKLGANDYITKPVDFAIALERVDHHVGRRMAEVEVRRANESLVKELTELEHHLAMESKIAYLAHHDTLTGLPNRFAFDQELISARQFAQDFGSNFCVLFIDLDQFKSVNDTFGHSTGDEVLKQVATRVSAVIGKNDLFARLGGDEFAIMHPTECAPTSAEALAQKIITTIGDCYPVGGAKVFIGASIGISMYESLDDDIATLLKHADLAMYRAKADGRGIFRFFVPEMGRQAKLRRSLEQDLRMAVENKSFQLYYQPIVEVKSGRITGFEALMRWNHATRGFVPPMEFIGLAEETGLIIPMGEWALRQACADAAQWPAPLRVAVNLSPVQFRSSGVASAVIRALAESKLPASRLELEITENVVLHNSAQNMGMLEQLRALGARVSLDDFGAGYAGLGYFRTFQFDKLKIDKSFIDQMLTRAECRAVVRAAVGLGADLAICTTAEGVESADQLAYLESVGCTEVQGYLFGKPRPNEELEFTRAAHAA